MKVFYFRSKQGASKILAVYWIAILLIVAAGIYGMVYFYYSHPFDVRVLEAEALNAKVADCLSQQGKLVSEVYSDKVNTDFDLISKCDLNFSTEDFSDWKDFGQYYSEVNFYDINEKFLGTLKAGNTALKSDCEIQEEKGYEKVSTCVTSKMYVVSEGNSQILIEILGVVKKIEKNVK